VVDSVQPLKDPFIPPLAETRLNDKKKSLKSGEISNRHAATWQICLFPLVAEGMSWIAHGGWDWYCWFQRAKPPRGQLQQ
jgi:hypothetical protein